MRASDLQAESNSSSLIPYLAHIAFPIKSPSAGLSTVSRRERSQRSAMISVTSPLPKAQSSRKMGTWRRLARPPLTDLIQASTSAGGRAVQYCLRARRPGFGKAITLPATRQKLRLMNDASVTSANSPYFGMMPYFFSTAAIRAPLRRVLESTRRSSPQAMTRTGLSGLCS